MMISAAVHVVLPGVALIVLVFIAVVLAWCFLCFRLGLWLASGCCTARRSRQQAAWCAAPREAADHSPQRPLPPRPPRRRDRPSSAVGMMLILLLACLAIFGLRSRNMHHAFASRAPSDKATIRANEDPKHPVWTVTGYGVTQKDAEQVALDNAYASVLNYVEREMPSPHWLPSNDYMSRRLVKSTRTEEERLPGALEKSQKTTVRIELSAEDQRDLLRRGRMLFLLKALGATILLLGAVAVFIRLDEVSKGYYTGWLTVVVIGVVAVVLIAMYVAGTPTPSADAPPASAVGTP